MFNSLFIALVSFLTIGSIATATGFGQPSWVPDPIPLVAGQEYKTGSPLSQPTLLGLFGSLFESTYGGTYFKGGGSVVWTGQEFAPVGTVTQVRNGVTVNGIQMETISHAEAQSAQGAVDWLSVENKQRVSAPGTNERADCSYTFKAAARLEEKGVTAYDWCANKEVDHASAGNCPSGQRLWVTMTKDNELGARILYTCR